MAYTPEQLAALERALATGEQRVTFWPKDSTGPITAFGPEGSVGVLFQDYDQSSLQQQVFFTRLGCVAGTEP